MLWDTDRPYHYLRWTDDGRLILGGEDVDHRPRPDAAARLAAGRKRLLAYLARIYPALADERPEYAWEGLFAETSDGLPFVGAHPAVSETSVCAWLWRQRNDRGFSGRAIAS
jgi:glycine/D-amino acid oxidase-like deaminating enzyme